MAILESRTRTGISWISESIALFKQSPRKWMLLALFYLGLFVLLPSMPGLQGFAFVTILIWPIFITFAVRMYRNAEFQKEENLSTVVQLIQPKIRTLLMLGFINLAYFIFISFILSADMQTLSAIIGKQNQLSEQEMAAALQTMMPILFKLGLLFIPLMVASWFSPMLIAFNNYSLVKAVKSSIAGFLQHMIAMTAAWLLLSAAMMALTMVVSLLVGLFVLVIPAVAQPVMTAIMLGCFLVSVALTLAFQYVSYRDVFRAALNA